MAEKVINAVRCPVCKNSYESAEQICRCPVCGHTENAKVLVAKTQIASAETSITV